jgi:hypothetical protein
MPGERMTQKDFIERTISRRTGVGPNELVRGWQSILSDLLERLGPYLQPSRTVTFQCLTPDEKQTFQHIVQRVHISGNACGIYLPPSVRNQMLYTNRGLKIPPTESTPKDDGVLLFTRPFAHSTIVNCLLARSPCTPAVDVYARGALLAGYVFDSIDDCLTSLGDVVQTYLGKGNVRDR